MKHKHRSGQEQELRTGTMTQILRASCLSRSGGHWRKWSVVAPNGCWGRMRFGNIPIEGRAAAGGDQPEQSQDPESFFHVSTDPGEGDGFRQGLKAV